MHHILYTVSLTPIKYFNQTEIRVFNGRLSDIRPVYEFAKDNNIKISCLEYIHGKNIHNIKKVTFDNYLPHDIDLNTRLINEQWESGNNEKFKVGKIFFEKEGIESFLVIKYILRIKLKKNYQMVGTLKKIIMSFLILLKMSFLLLANHGRTNKYFQLN